MGLLKFVNNKPLKDFSNIQVEYMWWASNNFYNNQNYCLWSRDKDLINYIIYDNSVYKSKEYWIFFKDLLKDTKYWNWLLWNIPTLLFKIDEEKQDIIKQYKSYISKWNRTKKWIVIYRKMPYKRVTWEKKKNASKNNWRSDYFELNGLEDIDI